VLHVVVVIVGAPAYRYFGAGERLARMAEDGKPLPAIMTLCIAAVFAVFAAYAWSGSGRLPPFPLRRTALAGIAAVFLLRGLSAIPQLVMYVRSPREIVARNLAFSLASLAVGACYAWGLVRGWSTMSRARIDA
jgi:putative oxidoreductase